MLSNNTPPAPTSIVSVTVRWHAYLLNELSPDQKFSLSDSQVVSDFKATCQKILGKNCWRGELTAFNQLLRLVLPEEAAACNPAVNQMGWLKEQDGFAIRPMAWALHDTVALEIAYAKTAGPVDLVPTVEQLIERIKQLRPTSRSDYWLGSAWSLEIVTRERLSDVDQVKAMVQSVLGVLFPKSDLARLNDMIEVLPAQLPFGRLAKTCLRRGHRNIEGLAPVYMSVVDGSVNRQLRAASRFTERYLAELLPGDVKAQAMRPRHVHLKAIIVQLSKQTHAAIKQVSQEQGDLLELNNLMASHRQAVSDFLYAAVAIRRNASNVTAVIDELSEDFDLDIPAIVALKKFLLKDLQSLSDQFSADQEWVELDGRIQNVVDLVSMVDAERQQAKAKKQTDAASLWLAAIGLFLGVLGLPDWFPGDDGLESWSLACRLTILACAFVGAAACLFVGRGMMNRANIL